MTWRRQRNDEMLVIAACGRGDPLSGEDTRIPAAEPCGRVVAWREKAELQHLDADVACFDQASRDATSNVASPNAGQASPARVARTGPRSNGRWPGRRNRDMARIRHEARTQPCRTVRGRMTRSAAGRGRSQGAQSTGTCRKASCSPNQFESQVKAKSDRMPGHSRVTRTSSDSEAFGKVPRPPAKKSFCKDRIAIIAIS